MNDHLVAAVMRLWKTGFDTAAIGKVLGETQHDVERALNRGLDQAAEKKRDQHNVHSTTEA